MRVVTGFDTDFIPSIGNPTFETDYPGDPDDELLVVETDDGARGYPVSILNVHHIANDTVDGVPLVVTYCPLCGTVAAYERRIGGRELTFEFGGKIVENNLVMRDEETGSEWKQSTGEGLNGELAGEGLDLYSSRMSTWEAFQIDYPNGTVLQRPDHSGPYLFQQFAATTTGLLEHPAGREVMDAAFSLVRAANLARDPEDGTREVSVSPFMKLLTGVVELRGWISDADSPDGSGDAYADVTSVFEREDTFGYLDLHGGPEQWEADGPDDLTAKTRVLGVTVDDDAVGFARPRVEAAGGLVRTTVGETDVVVFDADGTLVAYEDPGFPFERDADGTVRGDGTTWDPATGNSDDGRSLDRLATSWTYAYAWQTDHAPSSFYQVEVTDATA
ncbi:Protein of unknown function [Halomicrobium zhouii]|uniref:DUF3179 domain-containing protein n=1 Tax=Halomicrobium zhouii TaxID=767519 RepID=A0A1I6KIR5_9EURY|nr:DUF3179 domain-containing (seleno)protein [Halomicrobium zhouii]SFR91101.1 Protein of unknown function [Halomicrobium zhouii]